MGGGHGELLVSLADGDAFEWRAGDLEHQTGFIRVKLNHDRGVVESDLRNNQLQIGVVDYYPRRR
ncbi:MAG: hypothetical protein JRH01_23385 [Deltaproteobacteria bacterium]|nr:hypothetical protein [Deltaproteobacteria bacterium]MBW2395835.1 hypothetical protein [Deltaproteobacteria bacterium]